MPCTVTDTRGRSRNVRNLGWLLRHRHEVLRFEVREPQNPRYDCELRAALEGGIVYRCDFASTHVLAGFLSDRRAWRTLRVLWFGQEGAVGKKGIVGLNGMLEAVK